MPSRGYRKGVNDDRVAVPCSIRTHISAAEKQRLAADAKARSLKGQPIVRISAWSRKDKSDRAMLSGATSYPLPNRSEAEQQAAQADLMQLVDSGAVSKGMPKGKGKGRE